MAYTLSFKDISIQDIAKVGGKNASLGEMINQLSELGIHVPRGYAVTVAAYHDFLTHNNLNDQIFTQLKEIDVNDVQTLKAVSLDIQEKIVKAELPQTIVDDVLQAYHDLKLAPDQSVAVRSSATAEDLPEASFAGQQDTYLNVSGEKNILHAIKKVYASLFTERAIAYRHHHHFDHEQIAISVGIQRMIRSDLACSGVIFTLDTESGFDQVVFITAAYGLGEAVVQGSVNPDEFFVHKPTLEQGFNSIVSRELGSKALKMIYAEQKDADTIKLMDVSEVERDRFCLTDEEILLLAHKAVQVEKHYAKPMDIEWAKDGIDQQLYIIQARPETVKARDNHQVIEQYQLSTQEEPLAIGRSVGNKIGQGTARVISDPSTMDQLKPGEVLVADMTDPDWEPVMKRAAAIVTDRGGRTCHAAIVARELGIPAVVGCGDATSVLQTGKEITVSCANGETGYIYPGMCEFEVHKTEITELPTIPIDLCMNLANPEQAFSYQFLPNKGVGLARLEFIIGNMIGIHPNALLHLDNLDAKTQKLIHKKTTAYATPIEFYIEKMAEGVATIAAAFYPKPIIVRFSDFKSNEYANLLGGQQFEPLEENPMIGYRGASRYLSGDFKPCFALECEAIKRVRNDKGLTNTHVMFPFVRTLAEAKQLIEITEGNGIQRKDGELKMYMMCEIPSNAILAEEFLEMFDGFSIGSNDLTQLALGLDRDSELVANLFDERDQSVKALLHNVIQTARRLNKYVGICGQGPSDHTDLAVWLADEGIQSMSLSPDTIVQTWLTLGKKYSGVIHIPKPV